MYLQSRKHHKGRLRPKATIRLGSSDQEFQGVGNGERTGNHCLTKRCRTHMETGASLGGWMGPAWAGGGGRGRGRGGRVTFQELAPGQQNMGLGSRELCVMSSEETAGSFFLPRGHRGRLESARAVLRSASRFYVYILHVGFSFLSTFQSLLNSVPIRSLPLPACQCYPCSQPSGDIFPKHSLCMFKA